MKNNLYILPILFIIFITTCCSKLFVPQELSENYALQSGVICNAPEVVDGDLSTISQSSRILISMPEKKSIRKIIIHSLNISDFILYQSIGGEGEWKIIKGIKGNKQTSIEIDTQVITDKIRMFISDTRGKRYADPGTIEDVDGNTNLFTRQVDAPPQIQEIEIYGLVDKTQPKEPLKPLF
ncbi:hypothetical protein GF312_02255 [Candidatus Poribacteria bacterium]|nr:hypothetical protein [Candidatus Poribacteria bacterium]